MAPDLDHDRIREVEDRSATLALLDLVRAPDTPDEERADAFKTLGLVSDHRAIAPLVAMLEDRTIDDDIRRAAAEVLDDIDDTTTLSQRARWWNEGDQVIREYVLGRMGRAEAELVVAVASDPDDPLQAWAVEAMSFDYDEAPNARVFVHALLHDDPRVRAAAADSAIWDEWALLEDVLLQAASDEDATVAGAALYTLGWYPTRQVLRELSELEPHDDPDVRDQAADTFERLRERFEAVLQDAEPLARPALEAWMEPVADLIDLGVEAELPDSDSDDAERPTEGPTEPALLPVAAHEIQAMLVDPDGAWASRKSILRQVDWAGHSSDERTALRAELPTHPDPWIRWAATTALAAWGDRDALVLLMLDDDSDVRDCATIELGDLDPDPALAPLLWARMEGTSSTPAGNALTAYVVHAPLDEAKERLVGLVWEDPREHVRARAIWELIKLGAADEVATLAPLLDQRPDVGWQLHVAVLDAMRELSVEPPDLTGPLAVDHLDVVKYAAALQAERTSH